MQTGSPVAAEIMAAAGFDFVIVDLEHGPGDNMTLVHMCQALGGTGAVPFVRATWNDFKLQIKRILMQAPMACSCRTSTPGKKQNPPSGPANTRRRVSGEWPAVLALLAMAAIKGIIWAAPMTRF